MAKSTATSLKKNNRPNPTVRIAYLIGRLDRALRRRIAEVVAPLDLTLQQYTALSVLAVHPKISNADLADRSFMTPQSANEMVKAMEVKGLISRYPDPNHGRIIQLQITKNGHRVLARADEAVAGIESLMLTKIPSKYQELFRDQLKLCTATLIDIVP